MIPVFKKNCYPIDLSNSTENGLKYILIEFQEFLNFGMYTTSGTDFALGLVSKTTDSGETCSEVSNTRLVGYLGTLVHCSLPAG